MTQILTQSQPFEVELAFTETYRRWQHAPLAIREAMCLKAMYPANLRPIREGDLFAGRNVSTMAGFCLEPAFGGTGYFCREDKVRKAMQGMELDPDRRRRVEEMLDFWRPETTNAKHDAALPPDVRIYARNAIAGGSPRLAGAIPDFAKLVKIGLPGLIAEVEQHKARAQREGRDTSFYEGMRLVIDLVADCCRWYANQARDLAQSANPARKAELTEMARVLEKVSAARPESFREAIQLFWLYTVISSVVNYGRLDIVLGNFYARDIDSGVLSEEKALALLQSLWQLIADRKISFNSRVVVGGKARPSEANADRFALLAMEATRTIRETEPQLTLRFYQGQNPALMKKALDVIGEGRTYPMLYNDDVNIPAVAYCFGVSIEEAEHYYPYGCGEYVLDHMSIGSPNCSFNLLKAVEATLHDGHDAMRGKPLGLATGEFASFKSFEEFFVAYKKQVEHHAEYLARRHAIEYKVEADSAAFLLVSLLYDGCLEKGKSVVDGGPCYKGAVLESFGMVNAADSLTAIKRLVYDKKILTPKQLLAALDANFEGYEKIHQMLLAEPKYGNDDEEADRMLQLVSDHVCNATRAQAAKVGLDYCAIVNINNYANVTAGKEAAASADGRKAGDPLANGSTPTAGRDRKGITALLNSLVKINPKVHAGYTHNMKFSKQMFGPDRPKLEALLNTYFAKGGTQSMITVVSRGDLENAMKEPEKYANLIVRVGGFSARFVELSRDIQLDLLHRTLY